MDNIETNKINNTGTILAILYFVPGSLCMILIKKSIALCLVLVLVISDEYPEVISDFYYSTLYNHYST